MEERFILSDFSRETQLMLTAIHYGSKFPIPSIFFGIYIHIYIFLSFSYLNPKKE